ncbi:MAG: hypothetical protein HYZ24_05110, partial [Chloroflexi bacterium]|nr:hypothetical protein [Chloroflexota bacterium]
VSPLPPAATLIPSSADESAFSLVSHARRKGLSVVSYSVQGEMTINSPQWVQARTMKRNERGGFDFSVMTNMASMTNAFTVSLQVPGEHNVRTALAALSVAAVMGLPMQKAADALGQFTGTGRRFEVRGEPNGILLVDDYAHHPTEIRATLSAARARYPKRRMWAVWQPHTYSRTQTLQYEFSRAFSDADEVLVTEVYASREAKQDFSSAEVVASMPHSSARYSGSLAETKAYLLDHAHRGDVIIVLSAGDADGITNDLLKEL